MTSFFFVVLDFNSMTKQHGRSMSISKGNPTTPGAYLISSPGSDKAYVGSTGNLRQRLATHASHLKRGCSRNPGLQAEHDNCKGALQVELYPTETKEAAVQIEQKILDERFHSGKLHNLAPNASLSKKDVRHTEEARLKIGAAKRGVQQSQDHIDKRAKAHQKPVLIEGVVYPSAADAAKVHGVTHWVVRTRIKSQSDKYCEWQMA